MLIDNSKVNYLGPDLPTLITNNTHTTPNINLINNKIYHNHVTEAVPATISDHLSITHTYATSSENTQTHKTTLKWDRFKETVQGSIT